jgi:hypothetical protein
MGCITMKKKEKQTTRAQLKKELNSLLGTKHNWNRLNKLDLERLVDGIKDKFWMVTEIERIVTSEIQIPKIFNKKKGGKNSGKRVQTESKVSNVSRVQGKGKKRARNNKARKCVRSKRKRK